MADSTARSLNMSESSAEWDAPGAEDAARDRLTKWDLRKIRTRRLILHAGRELFADRGFIVPRVEDVARAAGVSRAAFYLHFRSLEDLIQAVFIREVRWQLRRYRSLTAEILGSERRVRGWLERFFASFRQERQYILIVYRALSSNPEIMSVIFEEHRRVLASISRRIPSLGLSESGELTDRVRRVELNTLIRRIEEISLYSAFNAWTEEQDLAIDLLARDLAVFAAPSPQV